MLKRMVRAGLRRWATHVVGLQSEVAAIPLYTGMPRMAEAIARYEAAGVELAQLGPEAPGLHMPMV